ncbi:TauD/TfdA family dioxygenase [Streptomyces sp. CB03238]|uniref:TauD/TfdA family dioxygenase n=1 Tax=Streptomyces sp. CB03238 TaxID=1907777 RepID=UPI001F4D8059|nr:TauD/TfdA family dioxygenase [Streptomyces sp. CB03238]
MARYTLTRTESATVGDIADRFLAAHQTWDPLRDADEVRAWSEELPVGVRKFLAAGRTGEDPIISVSNLPLSEELVPTPPGWEIAEKEGAAIREEVVLLLLASVLGDPFGWANQQNGRLVHDVCPAKGKENSLTSASSKAQLALHTEDVFHACRGDYVALLCLRNPDRVGTTVAGLDVLTLPEEVRKVLEQNRFRFFPDDSHETAPQYAGGQLVARGEREHETASVLFGPSDAPYLRMDEDFTSPLPGDLEAEAAMRQCAEQLAGSAERVVLSPGEAVFLDNYQVVHGRDLFTPRYDGTDRWLKRTSMVRDLRRTYVHTGSRSRILG